jgi:hypothetical protein
VGQRCAFTTTFNVAVATTNTTANATTAATVPFAATAATATTTTATATVTANVFVTTAVVTTGGRQKARWQPRARSAPQNAPKQLRFVIMQPLAVDYALPDSLRNPLKLKAKCGG